MLEELEQWAGAGSDDIRLMDTMPMQVDEHIPMQEDGHIPMRVDEQTPKGLDHDAEVDVHDCTAMLVDDSIPGVRRSR